MYACRVLADSVSPTGQRLTTMEITYPRFVHAEFMTHRMLSRNSASSRAIPVLKMIEAVLTDPAGPVWWGKNQQGMQAKEELSGDELDRAKAGWLRARDQAVEACENLLRCHLHKQIANRLLEPWMWITVIVTATEWANFFKLRCHPDAQPEIQHIAYMMRDAYKAGTPTPVAKGEWHLPLVSQEDRDEIGACKLSDAAAVTALCKVSVGRCARVSYLTHDGKREIDKDIELCERLSASGHWSPFEHVATPLNGNALLANFWGWAQYRKCFAGESGEEALNGHDSND